MVALTLPCLGPRVLLTPGPGVPSPPPMPPTPPSPTPPPACPAHTFSNKSGVQCQGLHGADAATSAATCLGVCCADSSCDVWQWAVNTSAYEGCWIGQCTGGFQTNAAWIGGQRVVNPPPPSPSPAPAPKPSPSPCTDPRCLPSTDDSSWRTVDIPHDFVVEGTFSKQASRSQGYLPFGVGWYRKHITVPASAAGQSMWLDFDGTQAHSTVWLDGKALGGHASGYTPYRFFLNGTELAGRTVVLAARIDATQPDSWWYDGGGIYRSVWLTVASPIHIIPWGVYAPALVTGPIDASHGVADATVTPSVEIINDGALPTNISHSQTLMATVYHTIAEEASGAVVASSSITVAVGGVGATVNATVAPNGMAIKHAKLWSVESPSLYSLHTRIVVNGQEVDSVNTTFGVRKTTFDPQKGFFLNDVPTKINGCANHQDFAGVGVAVPDSLQLHRVRKLKEMGANGWRTAHNAPNEGLLDATDRLGFLVWDENHRASQPDEAAILVKRDRNHPSVIIWSICNEVLCQSHTNNGSAVKAMFKKHDPAMHRPTSANLDAGQQFPPPVWYKDTVDLVGFDYGTSKYDTWLSLIGPNKLAISSETSSAVSDRGEYADNSSAGHVSAYHSRHGGGYGNDEVAWGGIESRVRVSGGFTWTGWDYKGEPSPDSWPSINSHFGILDEAGFAKDRFYWFQQLYLKPDPPLVHLLPHWNWAPDVHSGAGHAKHLAACRGRCSSTGAGNTTQVEVWAFTNADEAELFVNGNSAGRVSAGSGSHGTWTVPFQPGAIEARVYKKGSQTSLASQTVATTGSAAAIRATIKDGMGANGIEADNSDVALVQVQVVDAEGAVVPTASHSVTFAVTGPGKLIGTGNGDPACLVNDKSPTRPVFHGLVLAIVQGTLQPGTITVTATCAGLPGTQTVNISSTLPTQPQNRL